MNDDRVLAIMAKAPRAGQVKTRLLERAAPETVVELYRCLLEDTLALTRTIRGLPVGLVCPAGDGAELSAWFDGVTVVEQTGYGLAAALVSTFEHFSAAGYGRIVAFNCDTPHLPPRILEQAFAALVTTDLVVGPTEDGGYYLVGARAPHPALFQNPQLGTCRALDALMASARTLNLTVARTDPWYDIDVYADLEQLTAQLAADPQRAPRTAAYLASRMRHETR